MTDRQPLRCLISIDWNWILLHNSSVPVLLPTQQKSQIQTSFLRWLLF